MGVPTKIARGTIEIVSDVKVVDAGNRVGPSEASLLNLLEISPFTYGLTVVQVYDNGQVFPSSILDITDEELVSHFISAVSTIASVSLAIGYPTLPSVGHTLINNYKNLLAVAIAASYHYPESRHANAICGFTPINAFLHISVALHPTLVSTTTEPDDHISVTFI